MGIFNRERPGQSSSDRPARHSRGWAEIRSYLQAHTELRVLDFGSTSPANINYLTSLGHGVYMANLVQESAKPEWLQQAETAAKDGIPPQLDVERFLDENLNFSGREFDVVLLWDTANYLPPEVVPALFVRLHNVMHSGGKLLAFFQSKSTGPETAFARYQLTDTDDLLLLDAGNFPVQKIYQARQVENLLEGFSSTRFFVGKDNVREVIAER